LLTLLFVAGFLAAAAAAWPLWRQKMYRELAAFAVMWALALYLSLAQVMHLNPPRPSAFLEAVFKPLTTILDRYML
jgi:hypothetical protein